MNKGQILQFPLSRRAPNQSMLKGYEDYNAAEWAARQLEVMITDELCESKTPEAAKAKYQLACCLFDLAEAGEAEITKIANKLINDPAVIEHCHIYNLDNN